MKIFFYCMRDFDKLPMTVELSKELGIDFGYTADYPSLQNADLAAGYECISAQPCNMHGKLIERFYELGVRVIATHSIGYDHIDLQTAKRIGMQVTNVTYPPNGVANYTIMLMMNCLRRMSYIMKCTELQDYTLRNKIGTDISNCTIGVIGTGNIGATVVRHLSGFGCKILAYDLFKKPDLPAEYTTLDRIYAECDVITLHTPATEENYHLICKDTLDKMKRGVCIINTARGKLINTDELIEALKTGQVGSAALDVMEYEHGLYYADRRYDLIDNDRMAILRSFPNVILTPHTAFYTQEDVYHMLRGNFMSAKYYYQGNQDPHRIV